MRNAPWSFALLAVVLVACGSEITSTSGTSTGGGVGSGGSSAADGGGSGAAGGFGSGPIGRACPPEPCDASGLVCVHEDGRCGQGEAGRCSSSSDCSTMQTGAVCGCDGAIYAGACEARAAGIDTASNGECPVPSGSFPCLTSLYCTADVELCQENVGFVVSPGCVSLPPSCDPAQGGVLDCDCATTICDILSCTVSAEGCLSIVCNSGE